MFDTLKCTGTSLTGMDRQRSARQECNGKKWENEGWFVIWWRVQVAEVVADFPSLTSLGRLAFQSIRLNLKFPHSAFSFSVLTLASSLSSVSFLAKKCSASTLMWSSPYSLKPGLLAEGIAMTSKMENAFNTGNDAWKRLLIVNDC